VLIIQVCWKKTGVGEREKKGKRKKTKNKSFGVMNGEPHADEVYLPESLGRSPVGSNKKTRRFEPGRDFCGHLTRELRTGL
jgi:hypothetical protein